METSENMTGGASFNKDTYIGFLKLKSPNTMSIKNT